MDREVLERLVSRNATLSEIARATGVDRSTVRRWMRRFDLQTQRMAARADNARARLSGVRELERSCPVHGAAPHRPDARGTFRCARCNVERVTSRRRAIKAALVAEAGGECALCGYSHCDRALSFHHVDPATKEFSVALRGHSRSLARARAEAAKCILLCANCHMEVESGVAEIPLTSAPRTVRGSSIRQSGTLLR